MLAGVLVTFSQSTLESIVALWGLKRFGIGPRTIGLMLFGLAAITVAMQGGLVRVLAPRFGEQRLALAGIAAYVCGLALTGVAPNLYLAIGRLALCGFGSGAFSPSVSALASRQADAGNRGVVMGTYQSGTSLARVVRPAGERERALIERAARSYQQRIQRYLAEPGLHAVEPEPRRGR